MRDLHHLTTDIGLRLGGALLCGLSYISTESLGSLHLADPGVTPGVTAFALAAAAFACGSMGAILLALGHHIFDQIEIGERWRTRLPVDETILRDMAFRDAAANPMIIGQEYHGQHYRGGLDDARRA